MRLHQMIEVIERAEKAGYVRSSQKEQPSEFMRGWCDAPTFEFGDATKVDPDVGTSLISYANELARNDMFHLPFERIAISFSVRNIAGVTILLEQSEDLIGASIFTSTQSKQFASHAAVAINIREDGLTYETVKCSVSSEVEESKREFVRKYTHEIFPPWIVALLAMLEAKGIEQRLTPAPARLNRKRVAAGKPPIGEIREIFIRVGGVSYRASGEAETGSHRSPRLHWRRGHVRRLPSGELTHVRPCLVGERVGEEKPAHRTYRVLT